MNELVKKFLKSPLSISLMTLNTLLAGGAALFGLLPALVALPLFALVTGGEMVALLSSKSGAKAIVAERDRERNERDVEKLSNATSIRKRLALLRIDDPAMKASLDRVVLASGLYLDECAKGGLRDPFVEDAIARAAETVNGYLKITDGTRVDKLLESSSDTNMNTDSQNARINITRRVRDLLDGTARDIEERLALPQGGIEKNHTALDEMESRQELEE